MATFAAMEEIKFDYIDDDVLMLTEFGELVKLETQELDRYLVLACNKGRLMVDVNGDHSDARCGSIDTASQDTTEQLYGQS